MNNKTLLSVEGLEIIVRREDKVVPVVEKLSFKIRQGEVFGLVGESGCGKTLTCLSILNLLPKGIHKVGGNICLKSKSLSNLTPEQWRQLRGNRIALIMQNPMSAFDAIRTIGDHFFETLLAHGKIDTRAAKETAIQYLAKVGLSDPQLLLKQYPFELSGGMLQRIIIAIALAQKPDIIIADEPTTALDATSQVQILDLLAKVRQEFGTSILLISHDLGVIARLADSVAVMYGGQIVEEAPVQTLFSNPIHPYTKLLMNARRSVGLARGTRLAVRPAPHERQEESTGCRFTGRCVNVTSVCRLAIPEQLVVNNGGHKVRCLNTGIIGMEAI